MDTSVLVTMIGGLFAITAPIAVLPMFVAATDGQTASQRRMTALIATATYLIAGLIALFAGNAVLRFFGVSVSALRVAGMAVVAVIGWQMLNAPTPSAPDAVGDDGAGGGGARPARAQHLHAASNTRVATAGSGGRKPAPSPLGVGIMPMGFPIYAGPGMLSVVIAWGSGAKPVYIAALVAILTTAASIIVLDFLAAPITGLIGAEGLLVTEKVFGLIVVAIAVSGMATALRVLFPGFAGGAG